MTNADVAARRNADAPWDMFSSREYWHSNYSRLQPEDEEILGRVSHFFSVALAGRPQVQRAIDVGSGTNLYPALLMLPWTERILLADFSASNVRWLHEQLDDDIQPWTWEPFWQEIQKEQGYADLDFPRKRLREACVAKPGYAGIEQLSVFDLPEGRWDLGTMFFVAESITEDPAEFRAAVARFAGALTPGAPFAAAFMAGSNGISMAGNQFPALSIDADDVKRQFTGLGAGDLNVDMLKTPHRVREGYAGMIVATGYAGGR